MQATSVKYIYSVDHLTIYVSIKTCCTPETNIIVYANYTSLKNS